MFRIGEAGIASNLRKDIQVAVDAIAGRLEDIVERKPRNFAETTELTSELNVAIESGEAMAHGVLIASARKTVKDRIEAQIAWPNGEIFACGDTTRDELLKRALEALEALERLPALSPMAPGIDLSNPQAVANRGLLRSFNMLARISTFGLAGQFDDDPLMQQALRRGVINQETLGMFMASLLELCVVLTAVMAARRGPPPFAFRPNNSIAAWQAAANAQPGTAAKMLNMVAIVAVKCACNMLWAYEVDDKPHATAQPRPSGQVNRGADPVFPGREVAWAADLLPFLVTLHNDDYVCIPAGRRPKASMAARALHYQGAAVLISSQVSWQAVAANRVAAFQLQKIVPDAKLILWEVFKLEPSFAQALRLEFLSKTNA